MSERANKTIFRRSACALAIGAAGLALAPSGCAVTAEPSPSVAVDTTTPTPTTGVLKLRWSIAGTTNPDQCVQSVSSDIEVSVFDMSGREIGAYRQACRVFATSISLAPGNYRATAVLLDTSGRPRTTSVSVDPFTLRGNDVLDIPVDFPSSSFLQS